MNKTFLPLLLVATLASPAYAFDSSDPFGMNGAQADKPAKAVREKNDGRFLETMAKSFGTGVGVGAAGGALMGQVVLNPAFLVVGGTVIGVKMAENQNTKVNAFYSGAVIRGRVRGVVEDPSQNSFGGYGWSSLKVIPGKTYGFDLKSFPSNKLLATSFNVLHLDVDGPDGTSVFALVPKGNGNSEGDIVDVKYQIGVFALNTHIFEGLMLDFNKHMPRVVNVYCKHDNPSCQNDYESSLGVITRHTDTEFPPSQYLIDPAIIAADQAKMRKEAEESKAASNSGGFSFM